MATNQEILNLALNFTTEFNSSKFDAEIKKINDSLRELGAGFQLPATSVLSNNLFKFAADVRTALSNVEASEKGFTESSQGLLKQVDAIYGTLTTTVASRFQQLFETLDSGFKTPATKQKFADFFNGVKATIEEKLSELQNTGGDAQKIFDTIAKQIAPKSFTSGQKAAFSEAMTALVADIKAGLAEAEQISTASGTKFDPYQVIRKQLFESSLKLNEAVIQDGKITAEAELQLAQHLHGLLVSISSSGIGTEGDLFHGLRNGLYSSGIKVQEVLKGVFHTLQDTLLESYTTLDIPAGTSATDFENVLRPAIQQVYKIFHTEGAKVDSVVNAFFAEIEKAWSSRSAGLAEKIDKNTVTLRQALDKGLEQLAKGSHVAPEDFLPKKVFESVNDLLRQFFTINDLRNVLPTVELLQKSLNSLAETQSFAAFNSELKITEATLKSLTEQILSDVNINESLKTSLVALFDTFKQNTVISKLTTELNAWSETSIQAQKTYEAFSQLVASDRGKKVEISQFQNAEDVANETNRVKDSYTRTIQEIEGRVGSLKSSFNKLTEAAAEFVTKGTLTGEQTKQLDAARKSIEDTIKSYESLQKQEELAFTSWLSNARLIVTNQGLIKNAVESLGSTFGDINVPAHQVEIVLGTLIALSTHLTTATSEEAKSFQAFSDKLQNLGVTGAALENRLTSIRESFSALFKAQGNLGEVLNLKDLASAKDTLLRQATEGVSFKKTYEDLANVDQFLVKVGLSASGTGEQIHKLYSYATEIKNFFDQIKALDVEYKKQEESVARLSLRYQVLDNNLTEIGKIQKELQSGNVSDARKLELIARENELRQASIVEARDYARSLSGILAQNNLLEQSSQILLAQRNQFGDNAKLNQLEASIARVNKQYSDTVELFKLLDFDKFQIPASTTALKSLDAIVTADGQKLVRSFNTLSKNVDRELEKLVGGGVIKNTAADSIKANLDVLVKSISSGGSAQDIQTAFNVLKNSIQIGFNSLATGNAKQAAEGLADILKIISTGLIKLSDTADTSISKLKSDFGGAFTGKSAKDAEDRVNALAVATKEASAVARDLGKSFETKTAQDKIDQLVLKARELFTQLKDFNTTRPDLSIGNVAVVTSEVRGLISELTKLAKQSDELNKGTLQGWITGLTEQSNIFNERFTANIVGGIRTSIEAFKTRFNDIIPVAGITAVEAGQLFNKSLDGQITAINLSGLRKVSADIRKAINEAGTDTELVNKLKVLQNEWDSYSKKVIDSYRIIKSAQRSGAEFSAPTSGISTTLATTKTEIEALIKQEQDIKKDIVKWMEDPDRTLVGGTQLRERVDTLRSAYKLLGTDLGNISSEAKSAEASLKDLGRVSPNADVANLKAILQGAVDSAKDLAKQKEYLDQRIGGNFESDLKTITANLVKGGNSLSVFQQVSQDFKNADYFGKSAYDLQQLYNTIEKTRTSLSSAKTGLEGRRVGIDPEIRQELDKQIVKIDEAINSLTTYNKVLGQIKSSVNIAPFERLQGILNQVSVQGALPTFKELENSLQFTEALVKQLTSGTAVLSNELVSGFKNASSGSKVVLEDLTNWKRVLQSIQATGIKEIPINGILVPIKDVTAEIGYLELKFKGLSPSIDSASTALKERLTSTLGQLEIKSQEASAKLVELEQRLTAVSSAGTFTNTYNSLRELMDLLRRPIEQTSLFSAPKESYGPIIQELKAYRQELVGNINVLDRFVQTASDSTKQTQYYKNINAELQRARQLLLEVDQAQQQLQTHASRATEFSALKSSLGGVSTDLHSLYEEGALLSKGMKALFEFMGKTLPTPKMDLSGVDTQITGVINRLGLAGTEATNFRKSIHDAFNQKFAGGATLESVSRYQQAFAELEKQLVRFRSGMIQWTMGVQMFGQAMEEPFKKAVEGFIDFSDRMGVVRAVSNATTEQFNQLNDAAILMGATTRFFSEQAAEGLEKLARAGFTVQQQLEVLPSTMRLAQAAATDLATAAEITTTIMNEFRMDPAQFSQAADVIALAANATNASVQDLGYSFKYVGALAANVGADFSDLAANIALMHNAGLKGCYDDKTEVLTKSGFKLFKDLNPTDAVMTINKDTLEMEWQVPNGHYQFTINEPMAHLKGRYFDLVVTDNHRLLIETRAGVRKIVEAKDFKEGYFFRTGVWVGKDEKVFKLPGLLQDRGNWSRPIDDLPINMEDWVQFLGWYFSEGSLNFSKGSYSVRITQTKEPGISEIKKLLDRLPFHYHYDGKLNFRINLQQLYAELESYGVGFAEKRIPEYVKQLSPSYLKLFLESFRQGDGDDQYNLYTSNKGLSEDLYEIAIKCGYGAQSVITHKAGDTIKTELDGRVLVCKHDAHLISISTKHTKPFFSVSEAARRKEEFGDSCKTVFEWIPYSGQVYSVNVPNGLVFVRRNGFGLFCGNTMAGTALRGILNALFNPTKDEAKLMEDLSQRIGGLGLTISDSNGKFVGFSSILKQLESAGITTGEVLRLFGQRAGPGMAALLAMGSEKVKALEEDLKNAAGTSAKMADVMENTLKGRVLLMQSAFKALSEQVGHNLEPALKFLSDTLADVTNKFVALRAEFPNLSAFADNFLGITAVLAATLGGMAVTFSMIIVPTVQFIGFLKTLAVTTLVAAGAMSVQTRTTQSAALAQQIFNKVIMESDTLQSIHAATTAADAAAIIKRTQSLAADTAAQIINNGTVAASTGKLAGFLTILRSIVSFKGIGTILKFLTVNPYGLLISAATTIGVLTLTHKKSVEQTNVELQKQNEIIEYGRKEIEILGNKIVNTSDELTRLVAKQKELQTGDKEGAFKLDIALDADKAKLQAQLKELFVRLTDESSKFKGAFVPDIQFDAKGNFSKFQVEVVNSKESIDLLNGGMKRFIEVSNGVAENLSRINSEAKLLANIDKSLMSGRGFFDWLPGKFSTLLPMQTTIAGINEQLKNTKVRLNLLADVKERLQAGKHLSFSEELIFGGNTGIFRARGLHNDIEGVVKEIDAAYAEERQNLAILQQKREDTYKNLFEGFSTAFQELSADSRKKLIAAAEKTGTIFDRSSLEDPLDKELKAFIVEFLHKKGVATEEFDAAVVEMTARFKESFAKAAREISGTKVLGDALKDPFNAFANNMKSVESLLEQSSKDLKAKLDEQKKLLDRFKSVIDEVKKYQDAVAEQIKTRFEVKSAKIDFELDVDKTKVEQQYDAAIKDLERESKVVQFSIPFELNAGTFDPTKFESIKNVHTTLLTYEDEFSQAYVDVQVKRVTDSLAVERDALAQRKDVLDAKLKELATLYGEDADKFLSVENVKTLDYLKELQARGQEYQKYLKSEYDLTKNSIKELMGLQEQLRNNQKKLVDEQTKFNDTSLKFAKDVGLLGASEAEKWDLAVESVKAFNAQAEEAIKVGDLGKARDLSQKSQAVLQSLLSGLDNESVTKKSVDKLLTNLNLALEQADFESTLAKATARFDNLQLPDIALAPKFEIKPTSFATDDTVKALQTFKSVVGSEFKDLELLTGGFGEGFQYGLNRVDGNIRATGSGIIQVLRNTKNQVAASDQSFKEFFKYDRGELGIDVWTDTSKAMGVMIDQMHQADASIRSGFVPTIQAVKTELGNVVYGFYDLNGAMTKMDLVSGTVFKPLTTQLLESKRELTGFRSLVKTEVDELTRQSKVVELPISFKVDFSKLGGYELQSMTQYSTEALSYEVTLNERLFELRKQSAQQDLETTINTTEKKKNSVNQFLWGLVSEYTKNGKAIDELDIKSQIDYKTRKNEAFNFTLKFLQEELTATQAAFDQQFAAYQELENKKKAIQERNILFQAHAAKNLAAIDNVDRTDSEKAYISRQQILQNESDVEQAIAKKDYDRAQALVEQRQQLIDTMIGQLKPEDSYSKWFLRQAQTQASQDFGNISGALTQQVEEKSTSLAKVLDSYTERMNSLKDKIKTTRVEVERLVEELFKLQTLGNKEQAAKLLPLAGQAQANFTTANTGLITTNEGEIKKVGNEIDTLTQNSQNLSTALDAAGNNLEDLAKKGLQLKGETFAINVDDKQATVDLIAFSIMAQKEFNKLNNTVLKIDVDQAVKEKLNDYQGLKKIVSDAQDYQLALKGIQDRLPAIHAITEETTKIQRNLAVGNQLAGLEATLKSVYETVDKNRGKELIDVDKEKLQKDLEEVKRQLDGLDKELANTNLTGDERKALTDKIKLLYDAKAQLDSAISGTAVDKTKFAELASVINDAIPVIAESGKKIGETAEQGMIDALKRLTPQSQAILLQLKNLQDKFQINPVEGGEFAKSISEASRNASQTFAQLGDKLRKALDLGEIPINDKARPAAEELLRVLNEIKNVTADEQIPLEDKLNKLAALQTQLNKANVNLNKAQAVAKKEVAAAATQETQAEKKTNDVKRDSLALAVAERDAKIAAADAKRPEQEKDYSQARLATAREYASLLAVINQNAKDAQGNFTGAFGIKEDSLNLLNGLNVLLIGYVNKLNEAKSKKDQAFDFSGMLISINAVINRMLMIEDLPQGIKAALLAMQEQLNKTGNLEIKPEIKPEDVKKTAENTKKQVESVTTGDQAPVVTLLTQPAMEAAAALRIYIYNVLAQPIQIPIEYVEQGDVPGPAGGKEGGLFGKMLGGLITVQRFAAGGMAKFKALTSPVVPGSGSGDKIPAMLEPGEFVIRKAAVGRLGIDFLNVLNSGLVQFKQLGGMVYNTPINTLNKLSNMIQPSFQLPQMETANIAPLANVSLTIQDKPFNIRMQKDQVESFVESAKKLKRGLIK